MRWQHGVSQQLRRLQRRYPFLRRVSIITTILTVVWLYTIKWGERSIYMRHIDTCHWEEWEEWPREAAPHHLVFIADPQLVDPHTYPGRPWPLSVLTERFTDLYMARNFRLINDIIDPDTIVFLGDLFDGGREWAPEKRKELSYDQRKRLEAFGIIPPVNSFDPPIRKEGSGLKEFVPGENGRWSKWGYEQWRKDFRRFGKIFFEPDQLYPYKDRKFFAVYDVTQDPVSLENGAENQGWQEYASAGGKQRRLLTSLPGNHDLGFGPGVQLAVRDRFEAHFGESNRIDVIGNHTFISLDVLSLSAYNFFGNDGYENSYDNYQYTHIWEPSMKFLNGLNVSAPKAVSEVLGEYYPGQSTSHHWQHEVTEARKVVQPASVDDPAETTSKSKLNLPAVVLSHVPLFRPQETECGPLRENSNSISVRMGYQYQNVLTQSLSKEIIEKVSAGAGDIALIFSGDDHDYCDVTHRYNIETELKHIREITVKSFSWAMGVQKPGFLLLSLWNPVDAQGRSMGTASSTVQTHLCLLPDQLNIFLNYAVLLLVTLAVIMADAAYSSLQTPDPSDLVETNPFSPLAPSRMALPRFQLAANSSGTTDLKTRQRGTSTSSSSHSRNTSIHRGLQRNHNSRKRSKSPPAAGLGLQQIGGPLIDRAGFYPKVKWSNPEDEDSDADEETRLGVRIDWKDDSQAKWKWRRRTRVPDKLSRLLEEFGIKLLLVGVPAALYYAFLVRNG